MDSQCPFESECSLIPKSEVLEDSTLKHPKISYKPFEIFAKRFLVSYLFQIKHMFILCFFK